MQQEQDALIRFFGEIAPSKKYIWNKGTEVFDAHPVKYPQDYFVPGTYLKNRRKHRVVKYAHDPERKECYIPKEANVTDHLAPTVLKIVPIQSTCAFLNFEKQNLTQQLSQQEKSRYVYNPTQFNNDKKNNQQHKPQINQRQQQTLPSPTASTDDDDLKRVSTADGEESDIDDFIADGEESDGQIIDDGADTDEFIDDTAQLNDTADIYAAPHQNAPSSDDEVMQQKLKNSDGDEFCIKQNDHFLNKIFNPRQYTPRNVESAQKKIKSTASKAYNSIKANHRTPITFATKALFCQKVEQLGMTRIQAWKQMKADGYEVGKSPGGCHKWAAKGSHYWMSLIAKHGDKVKLSYCYSWCFYLFLYIYIHISLS